MEMMTGRLPYPYVLETDVKMHAAARIGGKTLQQLRAGILCAVSALPSLIVAHEAPTFGGMGGELAAAIAERCFYSLQAPVLRVGGYYMPYPVPRTEEEYVPDIDRILEAVDRSFEY